MIQNPTIKKLLFAIGVFVMLIVLTILFLLISTIKKRPPAPIESPPVAQKDTTTTLVKSVSPQTTQQLLTNQIQKFVITLDPSVDTKNVRVSLSISPPSSVSEKTTVPITIARSGQEIDVTTNMPLSPVSTYTLTLLYNGRTILQQAYLSTQPIETPVPTNNPTLATFLPYATLNYILTYNKDQNLYTMHFKYDPNSAKDLTTQFAEAQANTNAFITGKGVDLKTITIEYLFK